MKKLTLVLIGIILSLNSFSQTPLQVKEDLRINGKDTISVCLEITDVYIKLKNNDKIKLTFENPSFGYKHKEVVEIKDYDNSSKKNFYDVLSKTIYYCYNDSLGDVIIEEELGTMTGKISLDENHDGKIDRILVLY